ncbi:MAG TPA: type IV secretion system protein, partial [Alphaproteobacteria bacterium]|nr:type IV secretion system protein [Alphaproteobacteria bacterium]
MASQGGRGDDVEMTLVLLIIIFLVVGWGLWSMFKQPLVEAIRWAKVAELSVVQLVVPSVADDRRLLQNLKNDQETIKQIKGQADKAKRKIPTETWIEGNMLAPEVLWTVSNRVGDYTRFPIILLLLGGGIFYMFFSKKTKFRTHYDLEGLIRLQAQQWPVVKPVADFDPSIQARNPGDPVPEQLPIFAEALSPEEWVAFHNIPMTGKTPDRDGMRRAFQLQLGPRWTGLGGLTPAQKCLVAAMALKGAQQRKEGDALLGRVALCWNHRSDFTPTVDLMSEVDKILNDERLGGAAMKIAAKHAYRTTAMLGMLKWARERGGVLASASFLWLRGHERALWYPLNNLGRRTYHA